MTVCHMKKANNSLNPFVECVSVCVLGFNVAFNNFSVILRRCLVATGPFVEKKKNSANTVKLGQYIKTWPVRVSMMLADLAIQIIY